MQRRQWILIGSLGTLVLCALPYGCSGRYVGGERDGQQTATDGRDPSVEQGDGVGYSLGTSVNYGDGNGTSYPYPHTDGTSNDWGDGSNVIQGDGSDDSDLVGFPYWERGDGVSACCDGFDDYGDGVADGASDGSP
jgi:hypothetical protein